MTLRLKPVTPPLPAASLADFQRLLRRLGRDPTLSRRLKPSEAKVLVEYAQAINAVLMQGQALFFAEGARVDTPEWAAFALALHHADPGKFQFPECASCPVPARCECAARTEWLEHCRYRARLGDKIEVRGT